jgi:hypothetical protein
MRTGAATVAPGFAAVALRAAANLVRRLIARSVAFTAATERLVSVE